MSILKWHALLNFHNDFLVSVNLRLNERVLFPLQLILKLCVKILIGIGWK